MSTIPLEVRHDAARRSFVARVDGLACSCDYRLVGDVMVAYHTGVSPALEGRGIASRLVAALFAHAREAGLRVEPRCSYVAVWARRHPEVQDLLGKAGSA